MPAPANGQWSPDYMSDRLADGRGFLTPILLDDGTRECLTIDKQCVVEPSTPTKITCALCINGEITP